jgi:4-hydroxythreonine-4-phosphate dehydrogenase
MRPLLLTMGDPTGVGPELIVKALLNGSFKNLQHPLEVIGDTAVLRRAAEIFGVTAACEPLADNRAAFSCGGQRLPIRSLSQLRAEQLVYGCPDSDCADAMVSYIKAASQACRTGSAAGMITGPINKAAINAAGYAFPGHTELLAADCGHAQVVMMLAGARLRVCLVTTHLAYRQVPEQLTTAGILQTIRISHSSLQQQFGLQQPRLAVLALNPHAGEAGLFGDEEQQLIAPAIAQARGLGINADGPHSADTLFHFAARGDYDAVICMYHDQGLIPLKLLHFDDAVNVTLGLPIIRTSVDHGTAYDRAGSGSASCASLAAAVRLADKMAAVAQGYALSEEQRNSSSDRQKL